MTKLERVGATVLLLVFLFFTGLGVYGIYDYIRYVRPVAMQLNEIVVTGKDQAGKTLELNRIQLYDFTSQQVLKPTPQETK